MKNRFSVSDELWQSVSPYFPGRGPQAEAVQRRFFEAVVFVLREGLSWRAVPAAYGQWNSVFQRFNRYARAGVWDRLFAGLSPALSTELQIDSTTLKAHRHASGGGPKKGPQCIGRSRGGASTKLHLGICGTSMQIVRLILTAGQAADSPQGPVLVAGLRPRAIIADRAYDTNAMIAVAAQLGAELVVPSKCTRKWPRSLHKPVFRRRNLVKRIIGRLKDWRRIATRYDKTDSSFLAFIHIAAAIFNLKPTVNPA